MAIVKKTYKDQVIDHIYQMLLADELRPGDQVKESLLSVQMGISRAPIREAMKELMMNGLMDYRPQIGNFIPQLTPKQIIDSYTTRGVLEGYAIMSTVEKFSAEDIVRLDNYVDAMGRPARRQHHKEVVEIGGEFHDFLISKSDNIQLLEYTNRLSRKLHILFCKYWEHLYSPDEIENRHRLIVDSLRTKDPSEVEQTVRHHYHETGLKITQLHRTDSAA